MLQGISFHSIGPKREKDSLYNSRSKLLTQTHQIWKCAVIGLRLIPLISADVSEEGTRGEPLRTSSWEANM